jgi:hypothetical protein
VKEINAEKLDNWVQEHGENKLEHLVQFLIETGIIDPLDWKAYLVEQKKLS